MRFINAVQSDWPIFRLLYVARMWIYGVDLLTPGNSERLASLTATWYPKQPVFKWMFGETTIFYVMIWNHPIETTIYTQMFQVPGYCTSTQSFKTCKFRCFRCLLFFWYPSTKTKQFDNLDLPPRILIGKERFTKIWNSLY